MSDNENISTAGFTPLTMESVWLKQPLFEEAEAKFLKLSIDDVTESPTIITEGPAVTISPEKVAALKQERVWFRQQQYEDAETWFQMCLAGTADLNIMKFAPGIFGKRLHGQDDRAHVKKQKYDMKGSANMWQKKFQTQVTTVLKNVKTAQTRLSELEKAQHRKSQFINDMAVRLVAAVQDCQNQLNNELTRGAVQLQVFKALLSEVEAAVDKTWDSYSEKKSRSMKVNKHYCEKMTGHLVQLGQNMGSCFDLCNVFQAEVPKSELNRIVGAIGKLTLMKKQLGNDRFSKKKEAIDNNLKLLNEGGDDLSTTKNSDTESSLEGSCSGSSGGSLDSRRIGTKKRQRPQSGKAGKLKKMVQNSKNGVIKSNQNSANITRAGRNKGKIITTFGRPNSGQLTSAGAVKRNAQGVQNAAPKKGNLFQFKGISRPSSVPYFNQQGLLGPRPNVFMQGSRVQAPFRFSQFGSAGQKQCPPFGSFGTGYNSMSALNQSGFGNMNFSFSGPASRTSFDFIQNSGMAATDFRSASAIDNQKNTRNNIGPMKQSKFYHAQRDQNKSAKKPDNMFGSKSGMMNTQQRKPGNSGFLQNRQAGLLTSHGHQGGADNGGLEQQLNEMAQKIQQMQLVTSQTFQLQHLMQETERLKRLLAQKHQQDRTQNQFQQLINGFMQQQTQGPQSKMARAAHFQNSQKQQQHHIHNRQQQFKKQKQQQNKVQQVKQGPKQPPRKQESASDGDKKQDNLPQQSRKSPPQTADNITSAVGPKKILSKGSSVMQIATFSPDAQGDSHRAGVSSIVVMEDIGCVVVVDIINCCLKLYNVTMTSSAPTNLSHHLVTRLEMPRPFYMSKLNKDMIVVSREGKLLSLIRASRNRLEFLHDIRTESQYYGLGYVRENVIVCAAFADNRIDLLNIQDHVALKTTFFTHCKGPELVTTVPSTGCILYLERLPGEETVRLLGISQENIIDFSVDLESSPTDVWSVASTNDRIICCNKQSGKIMMLNVKGVFMFDINFPEGAINQPFAVAFADSGHLYVANDSGWDNEYQHYITTDINVYAFS